MPSNPLSAGVEKIKSLAEIAAILRRLRVQDKKKRVVHCHGVFDLLHIGHIRHFKEAKRLGDVLVVTLTPDPYVNRGPNRPIFVQNLRAEAIAALDCVDYVAINQWPMAMAASKLLRPNFYVKGPDYKDAASDLTGGISLERKAVEAVSGKLVVTSGITFSSSHLINRHMSMLPKETVEYLAGFSKRYPAERVLSCLKNTAGLKVLFIGETIIDEYRYCQSIGKSSKEPMLAIQHLSTEKFAGGILALANNVANFCKKTAVITFLGEKASQEEFLRSRMNRKVKLHWFHKKDSPTIVKRRYIDKYFFTKLLSIYEMNDDPLGKRDNTRFCAALKRLLPEYDLAVVVDFGHGMISDEAIDILCRKAKFLAVNTQSNAGNQGYHTISRYRKADYICMADNEFRLDARHRHRDIKEIVRDISRRMSCPSIIVTGGKMGCLAYSSAEGFFQVPAVAAQVVDRMGAGDAFLALTAICVAKKAPMEMVGFIGNVAGAQAVATIGHRKSIDRISLLKHAETLLK